MIARADDQRKARAALTDARRNLAALQEARATASVDILPRIFSQIAEVEQQVARLERHARGDSYQRNRDVRFKKSVQAHGHGRFK